MKLFYGFLIPSMLLSAISFIIFLHDPSKNQSISINHSITIAVITGLLLFSGFQQIHRFVSLKKELKPLKGKTVDEKNTILFGGLYQFPHFCQSKLEGYHQGEFITDYNVRKSPYMFYHRALSYHFYPKLSLRVDNGAPKDALFLYFKKNPLEYIPENYKIVSSTEDLNYILAVKK